MFFINYLVGETHYLFIEIKRKGELKFLEKEKAIKVFALENQKGKNISSSKNGLLVLLSLENRLPSQTWKCPLTRG